MKKTIHALIYRFLFMFVITAPIMTSHADTENTIYSEAEFIKMVMDKPVEDVKAIIGEPLDVVKKGDMEFLLYAALVQQGKTDKVFKYTQLSVTKGLVQNVGNSNRSMH